MKLLLENWKRFINETNDPQRTELETKFFGNSKDIGAFIYELYKKEKESLFSQGKSPAEILSHHNNISEKIKQEIKSKTGKDIEDAGRGQFRTTYIYDNDLVIKIDVSLDGSGKKMNEEDKNFGTRSDFDIFPRCYSWDTSYEWIILEKVEEINNPQNIVSFFPNNLLTKHYSKYYILLNCIKYKVAMFENNKQEIKLFYDNIQEQIQNNSNLTVENIMEQFNKLPLFNKVCAAIFKFKMDVDDSLREFNCGIGSDDRFVILDSSTKESINTGLSNLSKQQKTWASLRRAAREKQQNQNIVGVTSK